MFCVRLKQFHQAAEDAYRSGYRFVYKQARNMLTKEVRLAKKSYSVKLKSRFSANDPALVWRGLQELTN